MELCFANAGIEFARPLARWSGDVRSAFLRAQCEMDAGRYVAGYVTYERRAHLAAFTAPALFDWTSSGDRSFPPPFPCIDYDRYAREIARIHRAITDGDVYQVNLTVPFEAPYGGDARALWARVAREAYAPYAAFVRDGERALLSWSPELFLQFDRDGGVTTKPMKGTALPGDAQTLLDVKNRAEHVMIVDLLRNDLRRTCDDVCVTSLCEIERYPSFWTMTSTIRGQRRTGARLADTFDAAFPCGSITGAPKRAAMAAIARAEQRERGAYCGSIGYLAPDGSGWWNVAIRTAELVNDTLHYAAGGGIVSDSVADAEWREVHVKTRVLRAHAEPLELWETYAGSADEATRNAHRARLRATAHDLGIDVDESAVAAAFSHIGAGLVRVRVHHDGSVHRSYDEDDTPADPFVVFSPERVRATAPHLRYKTSFRPAHRRAWAYAQEHRAFDALLCNDRGEITEGSRTNVFLERNGTLFTPPLSAGLLPGILRARLLAAGDAVEASLAPDDLHDGRLYVGNSARGLIAVRLEVGRAREAIR